MILDVHVEPQYEILVKRGSLDEANRFFSLSRRVLILTDDGVPPSYPKRIASLCKEPHIHVIQKGESSKNIDNFAQIQRVLMNNHFSRQDALISVGGGVVGDLGGFVASTYMRGIDFYNVPTTLLSQVDSSIGGKNAIDFEGIKNVIGTFKQPKAVLIDPDVLSTLDKRQLHNGLAESIKMGATLGEDLFGLLEGVSDINAHMDRIIIRSIQLKRGIVEQDEKEKNIRKVLNFGHTFGHAIEAISNGEFLHGEAVGIGMLICSTGEAKRRIENVLVKFDLPVDCPYSFDELLPLMKEDKKGDGDYVDLVSCSSIGRYSIDKVAFPDLRGRLR